jgi:PAT family beta-lactamase induction signal transducer AmpG
MIRSILSRKMLIILMHGVAAGLPLGLTGALLQAWMTQAGVDLTTIGIFSLVGLPYTWKFVWAPLMDRYTPKILGRRRSWILIAQLALLPAILGLGASNPLDNPWNTAFFALLVAFFSATQDIALDAYRTEALDPKELGFGASLYVTGYRIGVPILSVSLGLLLVDQYQMSWNTVYMIMAAIMSLGVIATLLAPEPEIQPKAPKTLAEAAVQPFVEFFSRTGALEILLFVVLFRLTDTIGTALFSAFILKTGFTPTDLALVKSYTWVPTILGGIAGGLVMLRIGLYHSLWTFGILSAVSNLMYLALSTRGVDIPFLHATVIADYFCSGAATSAFSAFLMSAVNRQFTATQFALLSSFMAQGRVYLAAPAGWMAEKLGWQTYFIISTLLIIPGLLMLFRFKKWTLGITEEDKS